MIPPPVASRHLVARHYPAIWWQPTPDNALESRCGFVLDARPSLRDLLGTEAHGYLAPRRHLRKGSPRQVVPAIAGELGADLIVMGTLSRTGIPGYFIGNTAEVILNNVECSVLAIKPDGFVSPVTVTG